MSDSQFFGEFVRSVAARYSRDGYEVVIEPNKAQRPKFLKDFEPDMIARRGDSNVIVEIKVSGSKIKREQIEKLSHLASGVPGWRVDLVYFDPESVTDSNRYSDRSPTPTKIAGPAKIKKSLSEAIELFSDGVAAAGFLLAWSAFEGAAMRALRKKGDDPVDNLRPMDVLKRLVSNGLVTDDEFVKLRTAYELRSRITHGMLSEQVSLSRFKIVVDTANNLLDNKFVEAA